MGTPGVFKLNIALPNGGAVTLECADRELVRELLYSALPQLSGTPMSATPSPTPAPLPGADTPAHHANGNGNGSVSGNGQAPSNGNGVFHEPMPAPTPVSMPPPIPTPTPAPAQPQPVYAPTPAYPPAGQFAEPVTPAAPPTPEPQNGNGIPNSAPSTGIPPHGGIPTNGHPVNPNPVNGNGHSPNGHAHPYPGNPTQELSVADVAPTLTPAVEPATLDENDYVAFCHQVSPLGDMRRVVVAAEAADRYLGIASVDPDELSRLFRLAGWPLPHNFVQTLRNAARSKFRWLERIAGQSGHYRVTDTGRSIVLGESKGAPTVLTQAAIPAAIATPTPAAAAIPIAG